MYFYCNNSFFIDFFYFEGTMIFLLTILLFEQIFREIKIRHAKLNSNDLNQVRKKMHFFIKIRRASFSLIKSMTF
jgi:preprotein translocase subunit SecY